MLTATRSAYVQVRCAVVALWSERHQRYAARTRLGTSNLTQNSGFAGCSFLGPIGRAVGGSLELAKKYLELRGLNFTWTDPRFLLDQALSGRCREPTHSGPTP